MAIPAETDGAPAHAARAGALDSPLRTVLRRDAALLREAFGYETVRDLLEHYPRRWLTRGELSDLADARTGEAVTVVGSIAKVVKKNVPRRGRPLRILEVTVVQAGRAVVCTWFNQPWHADKLPVGTTAAFSGKLEWRAGRLGMGNPAYEILREGDDPAAFADEVLAVYPATKDISSGRIRKAVATLLDTIGPPADPLPGELLTRRRLCSRAEALHDIHRPADLPAITRARSRLVYEELLLLQLGLALRRRALAADGAASPLEVDGPLTKELLERLPFRPTAAQSRVMAEIGADLAAARPMQRLLQGDVGSGKTLVALWTMLCAVQSGRQAALMAPTEVLAEQHHLNLRALLDQLGTGGRPDDGRLFGGPRIALLTAGVTGAARARIAAQVAAGEIDIVVGTHALLSEGIDFADLAAVVVDEQHRFGVEQRRRLQEKGGQPHLLTMTATPIPRTLALTFYGDLDVSELDELPPGRTPVQTFVASEQWRSRAYDRVREEVRKGHQAFVICALKDDAEATADGQGSRAGGRAAGGGVGGATAARTPLRAAKAEAERLRTEVFPDLRVGLVHGDMSGKEKEAAMAAFRSGATDVLVSTTVVEVGVDVPNATVMLVEDADRFGLSQLHQLRGRVGRGASEGLCILFADPDTPDGKARMEAVAGTTDGFALADADLELRGEGTMFDARQSGLTDLKLARLSKDRAWVTAARDDARALVEADPELGRPEHAQLRDEVAARLGPERAGWLATG